MHHLPQSPCAINGCAFTEFSADQQLEWSTLPGVPRSESRGYRETEPLGGVDSKHPRVGHEQGIFAGQCRKLSFGGPECMHFLPCATQCARRDSVAAPAK